MSKITLEQAAQTIMSAQRIVIAAHINPDGDALGSSLGLMHGLKTLGKDTRVVIDDKIPTVFSVLPGLENIERPQGDDLPADLLVVLDASLDRIGNVTKIVNAPTLNIDHHVSNDGAADQLYLDASRAATAEIIYQLTKELGIEFNHDIAMCLYTGIADDTGFFRYANTTPFTMRAAAELLEYDVKPNIVSESVEMKSYGDVKGLAMVLGTLEMFQDGKAAGIFIDEDLAKELESTEGFIDNVRIIENVDVAFMLKYIEDGKCRVSMRSKKTDVSKIAVGLGGGGHVRAAGCTLNMDFDEAKKTIVAAIELAIAGVSDKNE